MNINWDKVKIGLKKTEKILNKADKLLRVLAHVASIITIILAIL